MAAVCWLEERDSLEFNAKELPVVTPFFQFWLYSCTCWSSWLKLLSGEAHRLHIHHIHTISLVETNMMNVFINVPFESSWGRRTCWLTTKKEKPNKNIPKNYFISTEYILYSPKKLTWLVGKFQPWNERVACISYANWNPCFLQGRSVKSVLDMGCGDGQLLEARGRPWISSNLWTLMVRKSGKLTSWY